jgi:hypothetical protein
MMQALVVYAIASLAASAAVLALGFLRAWRRADGFASAAAVAAAAPQPHRTAA